MCSLCAGVCWKEASSVVSLWTSNASKGGWTWSPNYCLCLGTTGGVLFISKDLSEMKHVLLQPGLWWFNLSLASLISIAASKKLLNGDSSLYRKRVEGWDAYFITNHTLKTHAQYVCVFFTNTHIMRQNWIDLNCPGSAHSYVELTQVICNDCWPGVLSVFFRSVF